MASLVADYGTSSGSDDGLNDEVSEYESDNTFKGQEDEDESEQTTPEERRVEMRREEESNERKRDDGRNGIRVQNSSETTSAKRLPLPTPDFNGAPALKTSSVFSNPFVEAERAKSAILEKHVKMTPTLDDTKMINGRKICWNYRKGRCRFGHNCTFAHDSDLHRTVTELEAMRTTPQETIICQTRYNARLSINSDADEVDQENDQTSKRKKRPGLSQSLIPSKKVFKMYKAQQTKAIGR